MALTSNQFLAFFALTALAFFAIKYHQRWLILLGAGIYFYGSFIPVYLILLLAVVLLNYASARLMSHFDQPIKRWIVILTITLDVAILAFLKYFNFLGENVAALAKFLHWNYSFPQLALLLPVGLSFQIFQVLSYVIDVYQERQQADEHLGIFATSIIFFPTLLSGPIERPSHLLKQLHAETTFDYQRVSTGLRRMTWGFFKKLVIADRLAPLVNQVYGNPRSYPGISLILATVLFAFQLYYDFSGYSDIVIGAAQVLGYQLVENFNRPYWANSISDFWRRWHISLSTWVRDYLYYPLARYLMTKTHRRYPHLIQFAVSILVMTLVGLWHGASWTFVAWGTLFGTYLGAEGWLRSRPSLFPIKLRPELSHFLNTPFTFALVCLAWIFFRANSMNDAIYIVTHLSSNLGQIPKYLFSNGLRNDFIWFNTSKLRWLVLVLAVCVVEGGEYLQSRGAATWFGNMPTIIRWTLYYALILSILFFGVFTASQFLYLQF